ncbi:MAG: hypothetical protein EOO04_24120 [Chitinophagaceae bacterium]|nr:MAG: hypothetical protein EOO04_24120 [Chitinophagaceae bacterium]
MQHNFTIRLATVVYLILIFTGCKKEDPSPASSLPPKADFFFVITNPGIMPAVVKFSSVSSHAEILTWYFDDGTTSSLDKPVARYSETRVFRVKLVVSNATGKDSITRDVKIDKAYTRPKRIISLPAPDTDVNQWMPER